MAVNEVINKVRRKIDIKKMMKVDAKKMKMFGMLLAVAGAGLAVGVAGNGNRGWMGGLTCETVLAAESSTTGGGTDREVNEEDVNTKGKESDDGLQNEEGVYDFKDNKTNGVITVTKEWSDKRTNEERPELEINVSAKKPSKSTLGYTVAFHGDKDAGLVFDDGSDVNNVVYNSSGQIVDGAFKVPGGFSADSVSWFTDKALTNKIDVNEDGIMQMTLSGDADLYAKVKTFEIKGYNGDYSRKYNDFNYLIPKTVTEIIFTDEIKPAEAEIIDVDADGDNGVIAWTENNGTIMKISTQIKGMKVQAAKDSKYMFYNSRKLTNIDFSMLNTANVTNMGAMFHSCSGLTSIDLTPLNTANVTNMGFMFYNCSSLTSLDLTPFTTVKVTSMDYMFSNCSTMTSLDLTSFNTATVVSMSRMFDGCSSLTSLDLTSFNTANVMDMSCIFSSCFGLTSLDLTPLNTANVTNMNAMFYGCSGLTSLDLTPLDTAKVTNMHGMFHGCSKLTSLDLTPLNTENATNMGQIFCDCSSLTSLDLTPLNTANVTDMSYMFSICHNLTSLDLTPLNTTKVTNMDSIFSNCSSLTNLDLTPLNTANVTNMSEMFCGCSSLTSLDLTPLDTAKVTNMHNMFYGCSKLTSLDLTPLNTENATNMGQMFCNCSSLTSLDLTPLNTANVTNMNAMFYECSSLTTLTTGTTFKFVGTNYYLPGTWRNTAGETFNGDNGTATFPSNIADTYTKVS